MDRATEIRTGLNARLSAAAMIEARERVADTCFLPGDDARPDCWPDERCAESMPIASDGTSRQRAALEIGLVAGLPLAMAGILVFLLTHAS